MLICFLVDVGFSETEVDHVHSSVVLWAASHNEVIRFDVTMKETVAMQHLNSFDELDGQHAHCFQRELKLTLLVQIVDTFSAEFHYHKCLVAILPKPVDLWNPHYKIEL